jgi:DNA-binding transcriptional LysR family regulator
MPRWPTFARDSLRGALFRQRKISRARYEGRSRADLARHDLIHFDTVTLNQTWRRDRRSLRIEPRSRTDNADASIEAAIHGLSIARLFSYHVVQHVTEGKLVYALSNTEGETVPLSI